MNGQWRKEEEEGGGGRREERRNTLVALELTKASFRWTKNKRIR